MKIPFWMRVAYWGLSEKDKRIKKLELEPISYEVQRELIHLQSNDPIELLDLDLKYNKITQLEYIRSHSELTKTPWAEFTIRPSIGNIQEFSVEIDYNSIFIEQLRENTTDTDEEIVDNYLKTVYKTLLLQEDLEDIQEYSSSTEFLTRTVLDNGKVEIK